MPARGLNVSVKSRYLVAVFPKCNEEGAEVIDGHRDIRAGR